MDPRKILGVSRTATPQEIQRAYREKVKKHHPDMGGDTWAFQQVQEAYEALTDPKAKKPKIAKGTSKPATNTQTPDQNSMNHRRPPIHSKPTKSKPPKPKAHKPKAPKPKHSPRSWKHLFGELPLQTETTTFILLNVLDIFLTHQLLSEGGLEINPIANFFFQYWDITGMIIFKLVIVTAVCLIAQIVALYKPPTAKFLLWAGNLLVGAVVLYSVNLLVKHIL